MCARRLALGNVGARASGDDRDLELVVHHLAVTRPMHGRAGPDDRQPVGDVVDRQLAIDRRQVLRAAPAIAAMKPPRRRPPRAASAFAPRPDWRMCRRKRHRVAHLPRLRQAARAVRRGRGRSRDPRRRRARASSARAVEARVVRLDQGQHRSKRRRSAPARTRRGGEVEQPAALRVHDPDRCRPPRPISRQLHRAPPLPFADIYTILLFVDNQEARRPFAPEERKP